MPSGLQPGDTAPDFTMPAALNGQPLTYVLKDALRKGAVVVYFYPSAYTSGCNLQAQGFAQNLDKFHEAGATVVGISMDDIERLKDFSSDPAYCAGKIPVASDAQGLVTQAFGLTITPNTPGKTDTRGDPIEHDRSPRTTFVIRPDGVIAATLAGMSAPEHVAQALERVLALQQTPALLP